jgi:group I intron endonuclease
LQNAHIKYGEQAFDWEIVEFVDDKNNLLNREQFWIDFFQPAYNKRAIANSCLGVKRSEESRLRMALAQLGRKQSPETRAKRSATLKGKPRSAEVRAKISASHVGVRPNAETRAKMSESAKRRKRP